MLTLVFVLLLFMAAIKVYSLCYPFQNPFWKTIIIKLTTTFRLLKKLSHTSW